MHLNNDKAMTNWDATTLALFVSEVVEKILDFFPYLF